MTAVCNGSERASFPGRPDNMDMCSFETKAIDSADHRLPVLQAPGRRHHSDHIAQHSFSWIGKTAPCFGVSGEQVIVYTEPNEFYEALKLGAKTSKRRIVLASLYLGTGQLEHDLVQCIEEACRLSHLSKHGSSDLEVTVLLDYTRGSRGEKNSRTMLLPLINKFSSHVHVSLYHTPDLRGILKKIVPDRFNETIGLTHLKVYLFDDSVIVSGANLSNDYFTNRQDRYVMVKDCPEMADFFTSLVKAVASFSFQLDGDDNVSICDQFNIHPFEDSDDGSRFKNAARKVVEDILNPEAPKQTQKSDYVSSLGNVSTSRINSQNKSASKSKTVDTWIYPLVQMGPFGITYDDFVTSTLMKAAAPGDEIFLASGYFNLTDLYMDVMLLHSSANYQILMASPQVNGFFGARGIAGAIPDAYTYIAKGFYYRVRYLNQDNRIKMHEYYRDAWTFHVKGLWYYRNKESLPSLTFVGSPNFGYRSVYRDLECQLAIATENTKLRECLKKEHTRLYELSYAVSDKTFDAEDRYVPIWARFVTTIIKKFF